MNKKTVFDSYMDLPRKDKNDALLFPAVFDSVLKRFSEKHKDAKGVEHEPVWNEDTKYAYLSYIIEIMECCPVFVMKAMSEITQEDYDDVEKTLRNRRQTKRNKGTLYSESTFMKGIYLIRITVEEAVTLHIYDEDILYGTFYETPITIEKIRAESRKKCKSLTAYQEIMAKMILEAKMYDAINRGKCIPGDIIGLYITLDIGCRPGELCGIRYGREYENELDSSVHEIELIESNKLDTEETKAGGKTKNAPRKIPISDQTHYFIGMCKRMIKKHILENWDQYCIEHAELADAGREGLDSYIRDKMYIACGKNSIFNANTPDEIAKAAKKLLKDIGFKGYYLYLIKNADLEDPDAVEYYVGYKDPTTYVLRRNFATQLSEVGCSDVEIEYLMGHVIVDDVITRNMLSSPEFVLAMARKMRNRPLYAYKETKKTVEVI